MKQVIVTGTCVEYGMQSGALSEEMRTDPFLPYAVAKDALHRFLESLQTEYSFNFKWVRLFYMFGKGQDKNSLLSQLDMAIFNNHSSFNMSKGDQLRDYLPVDEVSRRIVKLLDSPDIDGTINICNGRPTSVLSIVKSHIKKRQSNLTINTGYFPYPDYEPLEFWGLSKYFDADGDLL